MKYPKFIEKGSKICLVAPSFGATTEPYLSKVNKAIRRFRQMGYLVNFGENVFKAELPYISNKFELVGKEFNDCYLADNDCLISVGGGEFECMSLPYTDFSKFTEPKWFMGFSDNTNHCFSLLTLCDIASIYGACFGDFGMYNWDKSISDCYDLLTGANLTLKGYQKYQIKHTKYQENHPLAPYHLTEDKILYSKDDKVSFSGRLIGGCLDILVLLCGTKFDNVRNFIEKYKEDGFIWFLEACDLNVLEYRRALWKLKEAGWFKYVKGFLIGRPERCFKEELFEVNRHNALDVLEDLNVPIIADFDLGHIKPTMPIILGSIGTIDKDGNEITLKMELK